MAEAVIIAAFLLLLIVLQVREQKKIKLVAKGSWIKKTLSVVLSITLTTIFWSDNLADQIKLIAFAALIFMFGFMREGFSEDQLIKLGVLAGDFHEFKKIQIEALSNQAQFVSLYKSRNNRLSLTFDTSKEELIAYFEGMNLQDRLVIGEEIDEGR
ncbi:hypothetical protein [Enterococcus sp. AZ128]|uniref:hypothetical protein n=1 Tax=unclassified Enterococcus TaxID=2608891 RepID=UPI003F684958